MVIRTHVGDCFAGGGVGGVALWKLWEIGLVRVKSLQRVNWKVGVTLSNTGLGDNRTEIESILRNVMVLGYKKTDEVWDKIGRWGKWWWVFCSVAQGFIYLSVQYQVSVSLGLVVWLVESGLMLCCCQWCVGCCGLWWHVVVWHSYINDNRLSWPHILWACHYLMNSIGIWFELTWG